MPSPRLLCTSLCLGLLISGAAVAQPVKVEGFTYVKSMEGVDEYRLDANGLTVLMLPSHAAPVVSFQVTYKVGSRNEVTGTTGGTHLLEHLMFKGSKHFNKELDNSVDIYLEREGAGFNATTANDRTNYYGTLGTDALEGYIAIEADRMRDLLLNQKDLESEMPVVRNEFERSENDPSGSLFTEVMAAAYQAHPYHHPVIGWRSDIEKTNTQKLRAFYDAYYWPNNAVLSIVGDVQAAQALSLIKKYYGKIPRSPLPIPEVTTEEPRQEGPRRIILKRTGEAGTILLAFKGPSALHDDAPALTVLGLVLSQGKSSRLSRTLVDTSIATRVSARFDLMHDPAPFMVSIDLMPDKKHEQAEKIALAEIERIKRDGVNAAEIKRVLGPYRAEKSYQRDGTGSVASALNEYVAVGDWTLFATFLSKLEKVTPVDVQRVAKQYLNENESTTGWFVPENSQ